MIVLNSYRHCDRGWVSKADKACTDTCPSCHGQAEPFSSSQLDDAGKIVGEVEYVPDPSVEVAPMYLNTYYHCGEHWNDVWSSMCNDRCPACRAEVEPTRSMELTRGSAYACRVPIRNA